MSLLHAHQLGCQRQGQWVLRGVEVHIHAGERIALLGANGSGKTTLLRALHGLQPLAEGQLNWTASTRQAMLFQRPHLMRCSVRWQVALTFWLDKGGPWRALSWPQALLQARLWLQQTGWDAWQAHPAHALSVGQRQRLALDLALARQPQLLWLDEPTANLDPPAQRDLEQRILQACTPAPSTDPSAGLTLVFSSHHLAQARRLASRVIYLERGRLLADLPAAHFFGEDLSVSHPEAHAFLKGEQP